MKYMPMREFLRGGYLKIKEPTVISVRGYPAFTVWPGPPRYQGELSSQEVAPVDPEERPHAHREREPE